MTDQRAPDPRDDELSHLASAMLAARHFGIVCTRAISERVGDGYANNASIACLSELRTGGPLRLRELTSRVQLPGPMLSRAVDRLVASGDVTRGPGQVDGDGRAVLITITKTGIKREREIGRAIHDDGTVAGLVKEAVAHLEQLCGLAGDVQRPPAQNGCPSLAGAFARLGIELGNVLRSISPSGDIAEALTLLAFVADEHSRPSIIADRVGLSSGGTTKVLDRLESAGLIERTFGTAGDRRGVDLQLTAEGRRQLRLISDATQPYLPNLLLAFEATTNELDLVG